MSSTDSELITRPVIIMTFIIENPVTKEGPQPVPEAVIKSLPVVKIEEKGSECAICLDEFEVGGEAKAMDCRHKFHCECLDKWLRVNGSCPVCRCKVEREGEGEKKVERERREMRIRFVNGEMVIS